MVRQGMRTSFAFIIIRKAVLTSGPDKGGSDMLRKKITFLTQKYLLSREGIMTLYIIGCIVSRAIVMVMAPVYATSASGLYDTAYPHALTIVRLITSIGACTCAVTVLRSLFLIVVSTSDRNTEAQLSAIRTSLTALFILQALPVIFGGVLSSMDEMEVDFGMMAPGNGK